MKTSKMKRFALVAPVFLVILFIYIVSMDKKMKQIKKEVSQDAFITSAVQNYLAINDKKGKIHYFDLGRTLTPHRKSTFNQFNGSPGAFQLPAPQATVYSGESELEGNVRLGGKFNVETLKYVPHNLTHLKTSAFLLNEALNPPTATDITPRDLSGLIMVIDLSGEKKDKEGAILWDELAPKLEANNLPITMLAIKTNASLLPSNYNFSGKKFPFLSPEAASGIRDYKCRVPRGSGKEPLEYGIRCLMVDFPSIDGDIKGGAMAAHRAFWGLPATGASGKDEEKRYIVGLAWFRQLKEDYYLATVTPAPFNRGTVATGLHFRELVELE